MPAEPLYLAALLAAGIVSGFAGGLFGIGGGILRVPILLYLFPAFGMAPEVAMHMAAGSSLAVAVPGTIAACRTQMRSGNMDLPFLASWVPALLAGVLVGLVVQRFAPGHALVLVFAVVLVVQAFELVAGRDGIRLADAVPTGPVRWVMASVIGALSVAIGISGGAFTTPTLVALNYPLRRALTVSTATALTVSCVGAIGSVLNGLGKTGLPPDALGYVDGLCVAVMTPAVLLTAPLGVRVANRMSHTWLSRSLALFLLVVATDMFFDFWRAS